MTDIKKLALGKMAGFRHKEVTVPEWGNVTVILREPSGEAWLRWQNIADKENKDEALTTAERAERNLSADIVLFLDTVLDTKFLPVFSAGDESVLRQVYGPVHSRLVRQALDLIIPAENVKEKSLPLESDS